MIWWLRQVPSMQVDQVRFPVMTVKKKVHVVRPCYLTRYVWMCRPECVRQIILMPTSAFILQTYFSKSYTISRFCWLTSDSVGFLRGGEGKGSTKLCVQYSRVQLGIKPLWKVVHFQIHNIRTSLWTMVTMGNPGFALTLWIWKCYEFDTPLW